VPRGESNWSRSALSLLKNPYRASKASYCTGLASKFRRTAALILLILSCSLVMGSSFLDRFPVAWSPPRPTPFSRFLAPVRRWGGPPRGGCRAGSPYETAALVLGDGADEGGLAAQFVGLHGRQDLWHFSGRAEKGHPAFVGDKEGIEARISQIPRTASRTGIAPSRRVTRRPACWASSARIAPRPPRVAVRAYSGCGGSPRGSPLPGRSGGGVGAHLRGEAEVLTGREDRGPVVADGAAHDHPIAGPDGAAPKAPA
jgi:hypothetical protein